MYRFSLGRSARSVGTTFAISALTSLAASSAYADGSISAPAASSSAPTGVYGALAIPADFAKMTAIAPTPASTLLDPFHELESKYLFGFTEGADIGEQGEQSIEFENTAAFGKRGGRYSAIEQEIEYESVPTQYLGYELSAHATAHDIKNVEGLGDLSGVNFSGLSAEFRYVLIGRGPGSPIGLTITAEPEWERIDGEDGTHTTDFSSEFRLIADTELVPNHVYAAVNLVYTPEIAQSPGEGWERASEVDASAALAYRLTPKVTVGGELEYDRAYDGLAFQTFDGSALYVGPTLNVQFNSKVMLAAAFSTEVAGRAVGETNNLDLTNFEHYRTNLKLEFEF
jgi:Putative MetA-pathway of phenol degradation